MGQILGLYLYNDNFLSTQSLFIVLLMYVYFTMFIVPYTKQSCFQGYIFRDPGRTGLLFGLFISVFKI